MSSDGPQFRLTEAQRASFEENGFLAIDRLLDADDLVSLEREYDGLLDRLSHDLFSEGAISRRFEGLQFGDRYAAMIAEFPALHHRLNISLPLINGPIDPGMFHMHAGRAVFEILRHPKILDVVECIVGPEIYSSPVQQMRMKPPEALVSGDLAAHSNVGSTTWHQDIVALLPEADDTDQLTVWLAVTEATVENGCLVSVPASHREGPKVHCINPAIASEPQVPGRMMDGRQAVPLPVKRGGVILFHKMNVHRALPNRSDSLRWSMDLRYHPIGQASGRPAFPGFVARSRSNPERELRDAEAWSRSWRDARDRILSGRYKGRLFEDTRWNDAAVC